MKYCDIVPLKSNTETKLTLSFIQCMNKMGKPPKIVHTDGETTIKNNVLFRKI